MAPYCTDGTLLYRWHLTVPMAPYCTYGTLLYCTASYLYAQSYLYRTRTCTNALPYLPSTMHRNPTLQHAVLDCSHAAALSLTPMPIFTLHMALS